MMLSSPEDAVTDSGSHQHLLLDEFESVLTNVECRVHQGIRRGKDRHDLKQVSIHQCQKSIHYSLILFIIQKVSQYRTKL